MAAYWCLRSLCSSWLLLLLWPSTRRTVHALTAIPIPSKTRTVNLVDLLATSVYACELGCHEIRAVQQERIQQDGNLAFVEFKDQADPKSALTEADARAQQAIVQRLRQVWGPYLNIVGEEDQIEAGNRGDDLFDQNNEMASTDGGRGDVNTFLSASVLAQAAAATSSPQSTLLVPIQDVTVFVDPLDGTREFVEGRLANCQALVGIAVRGVAVAGAIGIPFPKGTLDDTSTIVYGLVGVGHGVHGTPLAPPPTEHQMKQQLLFEEPFTKDLAPRRPFVATGDAPQPVMVAARTVVQTELGGNILLYGGAGNKILATALGHVDATFQHKFGGPWDTCAPAAILESMGGTITHMNGRPLVVHHHPSSSGPHAANANEWGFVATHRGGQLKHEKLLEALHANDDVQEYLQRVGAEQS